MITVLQAWWYALSINYQVKSDIAWKMLKALFTYSAKSNWITVKHRFNNVHRPLDWAVLLQDINNEVSYKEIAEITGRSRSSITSIANDLHQPPSDWDVAYKLIDLWIRTTKNNKLPEIWNGRLLMDNDRKKDQLQDMQAWSDGEKPPAEILSWVFSRT